jgi:hypothetical protein
MNRYRFLILFLVLIASSCSSLYPPEPVPRDELSLYDSSTRASEGTEEWEDRHRLHLLQSNHASMLINNVILRESKYVLALSEQDLKALGISKEETIFVKEYIDALNKEIHEKD